MIEARRVVDCENVLGESALWHAASGQLFWLDLARPALHSFEPSSGRSRTRAIAGTPPLGGLVESTDPDRLVVVKRDGVVLLDLDTGIEHSIGHPAAGRGLNYNDAGADPAGRLWVGTAEETETLPHAALFVGEPDGSWRVADDGFVVCNGPVFSRDGSIMYFSDTLNALVLAYDVEHGVLSNRRVFARLAADEGLPDGLALDADGDLWVAHWGGSRVTCWAPDGSKRSTVQVPAVNVTSLAFGGDGLATIFVTTARDPFEGGERSPGSGALYAFEPGVCGYPGAATAVGIS